MANVLKFSNDFDCNVSDSFSSCIVKVSPNLIAVSYNKVKKLEERRKILLLFWLWQKLFNRFQLSQLFARFVWKAKENWLYNINALWGNLVLNAPKYKRSDFWNLYFFNVKDTCFSFILKSVYINRGEGIFKAWGFFFIKFDN